MVVCFLWFSVFTRDNRSFLVSFCRDELSWSRWQMHCPTPNLDSLLEFVPNWKEYLLSDVSTFLHTLACLQSGEKSQSNGPSTSAESESSKGTAATAFDQRTEESSATQYFQVSVFSFVLCPGSGKLAFAKCPRADRDLTFGFVNLFYPKKRRFLPLPSFVE